jgi:hypothetical protein
MDSFTLYQFKRLYKQYRRDMINKILMSRRKPHYITL